MFFFSAYPWAHFQVLTVPVAVGLASTATVAESSTRWPLFNLLEQIYAWKTALGVHLDPVLEHHLLASIFHLFLPRAFPPPSSKLSMSSTPPTLPMWAGGRLSALDYEAIQRRAGPQVPGPHRRGSSALATARCRW